MQNDTTTPSLPGLQSLSRQKKLISYFGVLAAMFLASLDQTIIGTAMPRIIADLGGFSHYTWISSAYIIASAIVMPITGRLTDMYGRKPFYVAGLVVFMVASIGCGVSGSMLQMIFWRAVKGMGGGVMMATGFTVVGDLFPPSRRGKYIGFGSAVFGLSAVIGPTLGGFITDTLSWRWIFFINIPLGVGIIILFLLFFPNLRPTALRHRIDVAGIVTLTLSVLSIMLVLTWGGTRYAWTAPPMLGLTALTIIVLCIFILIENRAGEPILPLGIFKNRVVAISIVAIFLTGFAMFGSLIFVPLFFQGVLGVTATASGNYMTPMMLGVVLGSFTSGQLLSHAGGHYKIQGMVGMTVMALGMWLLSGMNSTTGATMVLLNVSVTGIGLGMTMPLYTIAVQNAVPYKLLGVATSTTPFFRSLGGAFGLAILGAVMHHRFFNGLRQALPASVETVLPADKLAQLANHPRVLVDPEKQDQLRAVFEQSGPAGNQAYELLMQVLRQSLETALSHTFFVALLVIICAFGVHLMIKELPLRSEHE